METSVPSSFVVTLSPADFLNYSYSPGHPAPPTNLPLGGLASGHESESASEDMPSLIDYPLYSSTSSMTSAHEVALRPPAAEPLPSCSVLLPAEIKNEIFDVGFALSYPHDARSVSNSRAMLVNLSHSYRAYVNGIPRYWTQHLLDVLSLPIFYLSVALSGGLPLFITVSLPNYHRVRHSSTVVHSRFCAEFTTSALDVVSPLMYRCAGLILEGDSFPTVEGMLVAFDLIFPYVLKYFGVRHRLRTWDELDPDTPFVFFHFADWPPRVSETSAVSGDALNPLSSPDLFPVSPFSSYRTLKIVPTGDSYSTCTHLASVSGRVDCIIEQSKKMRLRWHEALALLSPFTKYTSFVFRDVQFKSPHSSIHESPPFATVKHLDLAFCGNWAMGTLVASLNLPRLWYLTFRFSRVSDLDRFADCASHLTNAGCVRLIVESEPVRSPHRFRPRHLSKLFTLLRRVVRLDLRFSSTSFLPALEIASMIDGVPLRDNWHACPNLTHIDLYRASYMDLARLVDIRRLYGYRRIETVSVSFGLRTFDLVYIKDWCKTFGIEHHEGDAFLDNEDFLDIVSYTIPRPLLAHVPWSGPAMPDDACSSIVFYSRLLAEQLSINDFLSGRSSLRLVNRHMDSAVKKHRLYWTRLILAPHIPLDWVQGAIDFCGYDNDGASPLFLLISAPALSSSVSETTAYEVVVLHFIRTYTSILADQFPRCHHIRLQASSDRLIGILLHELKFISVKTLRVFETEAIMPSYSELTSPSLAAFRFLALEAPRLLPVTRMALSISSPALTTVWLPPAPLRWASFESIIEAAPNLTCLVLDSINLATVPAGLIASAPFPAVTTLDLRFSAMMSMALGARRLNLPGLKELIFRCDVKADIQCLFACSVFLVNVVEFKVITDHFCRLGFKSLLRFLPRVSTLNLLETSGAPFTGLLTGTSSHMLSGNVNGLYSCPDLDHLKLRDIDLVSLQHLIVSRRSSGYKELTSLELTCPKWMVSETRRAWFDWQPFDVEFVLRE
ncbi:hypothetical protein B0H16DRAFT_1746983 [Mycena metata]|uniref:Uncharacterized protein n=1 Tax=Mycena metata TaxID=1033252 RepID=A0AAD7M8R5_9AGAR|nr:hypothetical protein B0H16DRAFT_1746983 [Mycena metata]